MSESEAPSPRSVLEEFIQNQIDARKERIALCDIQESALTQQVASNRAERDAMARQIEDWIKWLGMLR